MKVYETGGVCSSHGSEKSLIGKLEQERPPGGIGLDGRIFLKRILEKRSRRT
jgi:hypothetical protein